MQVKVGTIVRLKKENAFGIITNVTTYGHVTVDWFEPVCDQTIWNTEAEYFMKRLEIIC